MMHGHKRGSYRLRGGRSQFRYPTPLRSIRTPPRFLDPPQRLIAPTPNTTIPKG
jgi:hypothetical protein